MLWPTERSEFMRKLRGGGELRYNFRFCSTTLISDIYIYLYKWTNDKKHNIIILQVFCSILWSGNIKTWPEPQQIMTSTYGLSRSVNVLWRWQSNSLYLYLSIYIYISMYLDTYIYVYLDTMYVSIYLFSV